MKVKRKKLYENYERQNWAEMIVPERTQCLANSMLTYPGEVITLIFNFQVLIKQLIAN